MVSAGVHRSMAPHQDTSKLSNHPLWVVRRHLQGQCKVHFLQTVELRSSNHPSRQVASLAEFLDRDRAAVRDVRLRTFSLLKPIAADSTDKRFVASLHGLGEWQEREFQ